MTIELTHAVAVMAAADEYGRKLDRDPLMLHDLKRVVAELRNDCTEMLLVIHD